MKIKDPYSEAYNIKLALHITIFGLILVSEIFMRARFLYGSRSMIDDVSKTVIFFQSQVCC